MTKNAGSIFKCGLRAFMILALLSLMACHGQMPQDKPVQTDSTVITEYLLADSLVNGERRSDENEAAWILSDSAYIYERNDSAHVLRRVGTLHIGDSVNVRNPMGRLSPFMNEYYAASWHGRPVYIYGTDLGHRLATDFDGDGRMDLILFGYTDYDTTSETDRPVEHPMRIWFISATGARFDIRDTGYSEITVEEQTDSVAVKFSKPTKVFWVNAGYPACGYIHYNLVIAVRNGRPQLLYKDWTSMDSGQGDFYEINLPDALNHHPDTIFLIKKLSLPKMQGDSAIWDSLIITTIDSTMLYPQGDTWQANTFYKAPARENN